MRLISSSTDISPVHALLDFITVRGYADGPFFLNSKGLAVTRARFDKVLKTSLSYCNLDTTRYKGHSFRIGAASLASDRGCTDSQIRMMGRWKSESFKKYIRPLPLA